MTTVKLKRDLRQAYRDDETHAFAVGQNVRLRGGFKQPALFAGIYRVIALLPPTDNLPQYRIRNDDERHERVTTQNNLEAIRETHA